MDNYTPKLFMTQPIYNPTRPFATPSCEYVARFVWVMSSGCVKIFCSDCESWFLVVIFFFFFKDYFAVVPPSFILLY